MITKKKESQEEPRSKLPMTCMNTGNILVVGDWFVDEYWFVVRHYSEVSSHSGSFHYRIASKQKRDVVKDLCGGGLISRVLYELRKYQAMPWLAPITALSDAIDGLKSLSETQDTSTEKNRGQLFAKLKNERGTLKLKDDDDNEEAFRLQKIGDLNEVVARFRKTIEEAKSSIEKYFPSAPANSPEQQDDFKEIVKQLDFCSEVAAKVLEGHGSPEGHEIWDITDISRIREEKRKCQERLSTWRKEYHLFGLGRWHHDDDALLPHFIHAHCQNNAKLTDASFSLMPKPCGRLVDVQLRNLEDPASQFAEHGTVRCIRAYRFDKDHFTHVHRIDWEPAPSAEQMEKKERKAAKEKDDAFVKEEIRKLFAVMNNQSKGHAAVIVDDHLKGVVDDNVIAAIQGQAKNATWFVRTKNGGIRKATSKTNAEANTEWPKWLRRIDSIELLAVGPENSCRFYPNNRLLTEADQLNEHAFELIDALRSKENRHGERQVRNLILTSDNLEVVALLGNFCVIAKPSTKVANIDLEKINWTSAFFAALAYEMLTVTKPWEWVETDDKANQDACAEVCKKMVQSAADNAHQHSGVKLPEIASGKSGGEAFSKRQTFSSKKEAKTEVRRLVDWEITDTDDNIRSHWKSAKSVDDYGIINYKKQEKGMRLEIWRASTDLPGYIVCIQEKREAIRRIWQKINTLVQRQDPDQHVSIFLEADPGVGKTFLAEQLANNIRGCKLLQCDITQLVERSELLDLFDRVASEQAESKGPVFVFVDEINATLGGSPVYGAFLSPLEAKSYMRNGQYVTLKPCIWMFAGTRDSRGTNGNATQTEKREDFESRMTLHEKIDYKSMMNKRIGERTVGDVTNEAKLEQVYIGAQMINNAFRDVTRIDLDIIKAFALLDPSVAPGRKVKRMASSLQNVQYGRVNKGNCTSLEWKDFIDKFVPEAEQPKWRERFVLEDVEYIRLELE